jgi:hypothetical protein
MRNVKPHSVNLQVSDATYGLTVSFQVSSPGFISRGVYAWTESTVYVDRRNLRRRIEAWRRESHRPIRGRVIPFRKAGSIRSLIGRPGRAIPF